MGEEAAKPIPMTMILVRAVRPMRPVIASSAVAVLIVACATSAPHPSDEAPPPLDAEAIATAFMQFAVAPDDASFEGLSLAPEVSLALGGDVRVGRSFAELLDPNAWLVDAGPEGFRERLGPFSALDVVAEGGAVTATAGRHAGCAASDEPPPPPRGLADLRVVSIQPDRDEVIACMQWWAVDLFLTDEGLLAGVDLDLGAP